MGIYQSDDPADSGNIKKYLFDINHKYMIKQFEKLTTEERELLYKAPVLVSVLASCSFNEVNKSQKADAIKLAHLKTFTANPLLLPYYAEVEKTFKDSNLKLQ